MKKLLMASSFLLFAPAAMAQVTPAASLVVPYPLSSGTAAYTSGQFIANSATGTSVVVPYVALPDATGTNPVTLTDASLNCTDTLSTAWANQNVQIDTWAAAPTFAAGSGDRATFLPATGAAGHMHSYLCTMGSAWSDGTSSAGCTMTGTGPVTRTIASGKLYVTLIAASGTTGVTTASKACTVTFGSLN